MKDIIKILRTYFNMTQKEFAKSLGIPYGTVRNWEQGIAEPPEYIKKFIIITIKYLQKNNVDLTKESEKIINNYRKSII